MSNDVQRFTRLSHAARQLRCTTSLGIPLDEADPARNIGTGSCRFADDAEAQVKRLHEDLYLSVARRHRIATAKSGRPRCLHRQNVARRLFQEHARHCIECTAQQVAPPIDPMAGRTKAAERFAKLCADRRKAQLYNASCRASFRSLERLANSGEPGNRHRSPVRQTIGLSRAYSLKISALRP